MKFYQNKEVAITGGLGFLGSNLAIELVRLNARVTVIDPMLPLYGGNMFNVTPVKDQIRIELKDIRDEADMNRLVRGKDVIFHIGNQTSHVESMTDPFLDVDINCRGNLIFLEACRKYNPDVKIVYAGTRAQYGRPESIPVREDHPMNPTDIYGANKHAGEQYHAIYRKAYGMRTTSLRINNSYGPRHQMKHSKYGILNWMIRLALDGKVIPIYGEGSQLRDYNYVDDVIQAFILTGASAVSDGESYNLGSGKPAAFREIAEKIVAISGSGKLEFVPWPEDRQRIETGDYVADFTKIKQQLGWEPRVSFDDGLEQTVRYYRQHKKHYW